ncbi:type 1 fimbrial protein [Stenotrophomonas rhizophila]|uniref:fimbrial protein n=1 Tax=Stenotrophomonas rhizophila TaxID=216778 RepID=UPI002A69E5E6|nr:type 1 fimbrial protein [Stenotrophomonas rhizophila]MDY0955668.1 type 1 fimbrial protein [Stenotrophomonas rhizophila]
MNHIKLASALAIVLGMSVASAASAAATGGTIRFTGAVTDETCTISGGAGTDGGTGNFVVALDPVRASQLPAAAAVAGKKPFQVIIGGPGQGSCVNGKVARLSFLTSSPRVDPATGALTNALVGEATNTQVQVLNDAGTPIDLADPANGVNSPAIANNTATIDLQSQYLATGAATPGLVDTSVVYAVSYN